MPDIDKLFAKAEKYLQKGKLESALETLEQIYRYQPNDEEVLLTLGDLSLKLKRPADALRYESQLTDVYVRRGELVKAVATCRKILKSFPQNVATISKLAGLLEKLQKPTEALEAYREALELHRKAGAVDQVVECLQNIVRLDPENLEAQVALGEQAAVTRQPKMAAAALLKAAELARRAGQEDRWAELVARSHELDPTNERGCIAAAELALRKGLPSETVVLLEPIAANRPEELTISDLLAQGYLGAGDFEKAEPFCWQVYRAQPERVALLLRLAEGFVRMGSGARALDLAQKLKAPLFQQGKRNEFLRIVERVHEADPNNIALLEMLCNLYDELNKDDSLHRSLGRLFNLYLGAEQFDRAADTLERIIDVDPYGEGHHDRLLNLEGHIDPVWYKSINQRLQPPHVVRPLEGAESATTDATKASRLEDLIVEAEMYQHYQLATKLKETMATIDHLYPGAWEKNERLLELYNASGITPTKVAAESVAPSSPPPVAVDAALDRGATSPRSMEEFGRVAEITAHLHRESTPQGVLQVAVNEVGRILNASRCWGALGMADRPLALRAEYCAPAATPSDAGTVLKLYAELMRQAPSNPDGWLIEDAAQSPSLSSVAAEVRTLNIKSLLVAPMVDKEGAAGLLLVEECQTTRAWTPGEAVVLKSIATQVVIAVNNTRLRRLVRTLAGTDEETGLLPRSAYIDCLLAEASRARELSQPLSVCLLEPDNAPALVKSLGERGLQRYFGSLNKALQANLRQNDIAIRYSPCSVAVVLPDTPLAKGMLAIEKIRSIISQVKVDGGAAPTFAGAVAELPQDPNYDAVDGVTEVINQLEATIEDVRKQGGDRVLSSTRED